MIYAPAQGEDSHSGLHFVLFTTWQIILRGNRILDIESSCPQASTRTRTPELCTQPNVEIPCFLSDSHSRIHVPRKVGRGQSITCIDEYRDIVLQLLKPTPPPS